ncbi:hypothetical protein SGCOL_001829 [Colletotrichum sp. CLE4]
MPSLPEQRLQVLRRILSAGEWMVNASQTPLHDALFKGDFDATIRAAGDFSWAMNQWNYGGDTPLHIAAAQGHLDSVKHLVHLGCDINEVNWKGCTALFIASECGHVLTVQYLIDAERLLWLLQYVRDEDQRAATAALSPLIKQKEEWKQWEILGTYKTIGLQIREQMWEAAVESVEEVVDMLREKMAASPWDTKSRRDPWNETESEDEDDHQTESTGSEDEEWDDAAAGDDDDEE